MLRLNGIESNPSPMYANESIKGAELKGFVKQGPSSF